MHGSVNDLENWDEVVMSVFKYDDERDEVREKLAANANAGGDGGRVSGNAAATSAAVDSGCPKCGTTRGTGAFCTNCGGKL
jgi:hypothetical protein